jgi:hypothetical protein
MEVDDLALHPGIVRVARVVNVAHVALLAAVEEFLARVGVRLRVRLRVRLKVRLRVSLE